MTDFSPLARGINEIGRGIGTAILASSERNKERKQQQEYVESFEKIYEASPALQKIMPIEDWGDVTYNQLRSAIDGMSIAKQAQDIVNRGMALESNRLQNRMQELALNERQRKILQQDVINSFASRELPGQNFDPLFEPLAKVRATGADVRPEFVEEMVMSQSFRPSIVEAGGERFAMTTPTSAKHLPLPPVEGLRELPEKDRGVLIALEQADSEVDGIIKAWEEAIKDFGGGPIAGRLPEIVRAWSAKWKELNDRVLRVIPLLGRGVLGDDRISDSDRETLRKSLVTAQTHPRAGREGLKVLKDFVFETKGIRYDLYDREKFDVRAFLEIPRNIEAMKARRASVGLNEKGERIDKKESGARVLEEDVGSGHIIVPQGLRDDILKNLELKGFTID